MPVWDEETQEFYPRPGDPKPTVRCVMCGQKWGEHGDYVLIGDEPVCSGEGAASDKKCKWEYIEEEFTEYLRKNNVADKLKAIATNPSLDAIIALRNDLADFGSDETGAPADINVVDSVLGPLFDAEDVLKRGMTDELPDCLQNAQQGIAEALAGPIPKE